MADLSGYFKEHTNRPVFIVSAAMILLAAGAVAADALSGLRTASVTSGPPFSVVVAFMCWGLLRNLRNEPVRPLRAADLQEEALPAGDQPAE